MRYLCLLFAGLFASTSALAWNPTVEELAETLRGTWHGEFAYKNGDKVSEVMVVGECSGATLCATHLEEDPRMQVTAFQSKSKIRFENSQIILQKRLPHISGHSRQTHYFRLNLGKNGSTLFGTWYLDRTRNKPQGEVRYTLLKNAGNVKPVTQGQTSLPASGPDHPQFVKKDFASNRRNGLPRSTLQVGIWYDGKVAQGGPVLKLGYRLPGSSQEYWLTVGGPNDSHGAIQKFHRLETRQYKTGKMQLTGNVRVANIQGDGVIDGLAFGLLMKNHNGHYFMLKSKSHRTRNGANFVGAWPLGMNDTLWKKRLYAIKDSFGREQAKMMLSGAQYLDNGHYHFPLRTNRKAPRADSAQHQGRKRPR